MAGSSANVSVAWSKIYPGGFAQAEACDTSFSKIFGIQNQMQVFRERKLYG
jgi:hypothetical protein